MTDVQQNAKNSTAATLARLERLCGRFPVLSSEKRQDYEELLTSLLEHYRPRNFLGERLIKYLADEEWELSRYKRHKIVLMERRFRARRRVRCELGRRCGNHADQLGRRYGNHADLGSYGHQ
jgi:hypothetical protein